MCAMMQKFRMNFGSIVFAYKMFSLTNVLNCGQDSKRPRGLSGGPAAFHRVTRATQKPCRMNNQFATSSAARQQSTHEPLNWRSFSARQKPSPDGISIHEMAR